MQMVDHRLRLSKLLPGYRRDRDRAARDAQIIDLQRRGMTQPEIADAVGCSITTVGRVTANRRGRGFDE